MNRRISVIVAGLLLGLLAVAPLSAQTKNSSESLGKAEINRIINEVFTVEDIRKDKPRVHPSNEGEVIGQYHALRTAEQSRAELKFKDGSLARVGSDAFFSFASNSRDVQMGKGTALFQVPKNSEETNVQTATATASLTGTTIMVNQQPNKHVKAAVIEGSVDMSMPDRAGESRSLEAGEMMVMPADAERLPEPVDVDLQELVSTSGLINGFDEEEEDEEESTDESQETDDTSDETDSEEASQGDGSTEEAESTTSPADESENQDDGESGLDYDQMSEGIDQQKEEIESGELEETNMVIDGEGTEVTVEDEEDLETETTTDDNKDAVEQNTEDQTTLALDGTKEVYFGTDNDQDPPTADGLEGEIFTPSNSTSDGISADATDEAVLEAALVFLNGGKKTALFEPDVIEVDEESTVQPTDFVQDVAFFARDTINFNIDELVIDSNQNSVGIGAGADDYRLDLPDIDIQTATKFGAITVGDGSELRFGNVQAPGSFVTGFSRGDISAASGSTLSAGSLNLNSLAGSLSLDNNLLEAQQVALQGFSPQSSVTLLNGSEIRTLDPAGSVQFFAQGGNVSVQNSTLGYYDGSNYDPTAGSVILSSINSNSPGSISVSGSTLKAGEISYSVGAGDVSIQENSTLTAQDGSLTSALSGQGNLTTDNAQLESASNLSLSSQATSGQSFSITNSTQLQTLATGGAVTLLSQGGDITVANSRLGYNDGNGLSIGGGSVILDTSNPEVDGTVRIENDGNFPSSGAYDSNKADMMATAVKARAHGPDGELLVSDSLLAANDILKLYAPGKNGRVRFTGNTRLDVAGLLEIAADTVRVDNGVKVAVTTSTLTPEVYADKHKYGSADVAIPTKCGSDGSSKCGVFTDGSGNKITISRFNEDGEQDKGGF